MKDATTGDWRVEVETCDNIRASVFITGFEQQTPSLATTMITIADRFETDVDTINLLNFATGPSQ